MGCGGYKKSTIKSQIRRRSQRIKSTPDDFITRNLKSFQEVYKVGRTLGSGAYGEVKQVTHRITSQERAVKIFRKSQETHETYLKVKREIEILKSLNHPSIIKMFEYFEDDLRIYIVLEKCDGGELFSEISNKGNLDEQVSAIICKQLFSSILYLHENNIVHRDLKPENILLEDKNDALNIKLIDFGTAVELSPSHTLNELIGSSYYLPPEVIEGSYDHRCDIWSLGVILYILLCGFPPFTGNSTKNIMSKIMIGKFSLDGRIWDHISAEAKDLIKKLLCPASSRLSAAAALQHPWIQSNGMFPRPDQSVLEEAIKNLKDFNSLNIFRDAISSFITSQVISIHDTKDLRSIFKNIDTNGDGKLSKEELVRGLGIHDDLDPNNDFVDKIIKEVDTDGNGYIDYDEFIKASINQKNLYSKENLRKAFDLFDLDGSGKISSVELEKIFSIGEVSDSLWNQVVSQADKNLDGEIDFEEFCVFISQLSGTNNLF